MADEQKQPSDDYQYPQDEYVGESSPTPTVSEDHYVDPDNTLPGKESSEGSPLKAFWSNNKRIILIVVGAGIVALGFKLLGPTREKLPTPVPVATAPVSVSNAPPAPLPVPSVDQMQTQNNLQNMASNISDNKSAVQSLQNDVANLKSSLGDLQATQTQMSNTLAAMARQQADLAEKLKPPPKPKVQTPPITPITYSLRAIIPGRAWIDGSNGNSLSVTTGDSIPQYGIITQIDPESGTLATSSGKTITFNNNDR